MKKLLVFSLILICGCHGAMDKKAEPAASSEPAVTLPSVETLEDGTILITPGNDGKAVTGCTMGGLGSYRTFAFDTSDSLTLKAVVTPASEPANIRINQIISPSGEADGPFGRDMEYPLDEPGRWKIVIGESNMQGDDYNGGFSLSIELAAKN